MDPKALTDFDPAALRVRPSDRAPDATLPELLLPEPGVDLDAILRQKQRLRAELFDVEAEPTRLGHYELLEEIGRGGMGVVYAAHDHKLHRKVAIKQLQIPDSTLLRRRLVNEAQAMAKLAHPNVVSIYEIGQAGSTTFIVMEYIEGLNLREWLGRGHPLPEVIEVLLAAGRGLAAAHGAGMVHRDFKPDNVMVGDDGRVRVMDFGLARADRRRQDTVVGAQFGSLRVSDGALTPNGAIIGTPRYMAPEQLGGTWADAKSDQFAYCVTFFLALYGVWPFDGATVSELRAAIERGAIQPAPRHSRVPTWLRELIVRGLTAAPRERFESVQVLIASIEAGLHRAAVDGAEPPEYVFVVHDDHHKLEVLRLCEGLLDHGVRAWLDMWELGEDYERAARSRDALLDAPAVLICHGQRGWGERAHGEAVRERMDADPESVFEVWLADVNPKDAPMLLGEGPPALVLDGRDDGDALAKLAERVGVDRARRGWLDHEAARIGDSPEGVIPYRGLEAFRERDARWMFGRELETAELIERIRADEPRFLTVIGASGSGKSSLVMAGLCPALRSGAVDGRSWSIAQLRPGARPCESLAHALVNLQTSPAAVSDPVADAMKVANLREQMLARADTLKLVVERVVSSWRARDQARELMLVVDQLEELFSEARLDHDDASPEAVAFVRNVLVATKSDGPMWVVSTLRADFVQRCLEVGDLAQAVKSGAYFALPPMDEAQVRAAIVRPAKRVGYEIDAELVDKLVHRAANQAGRLPLLQHVLRELWQRRDPSRRRLPYEVYAETGGLERAIAVAAERALDGLRAQFGERAQILTRRVMTRLVHLGEGNAGHTRRRAAATELGTDEETRAVLNAFVREARVLVASDVEGVEVFELAHEALLREWTTLVEWLEADREALHLRQEIAADADKRREHDEREYLWGRGRLGEAQRVLAASTVELNEAEGTFLRESQRRALLGQVLVWLSTGAVALAGFAVALLLFNKNGEIEAQGEKLREDAKQLESNNANLAELVSLHRAREARDLVEGDHELEALSQAILALGDSFGDGLEPRAPAEAIEQVEQVLAHDAILVDSTWVSRGHDDSLHALAYSPSGAEVASASYDGTIATWDTTSGARRHTLAVDDGGDTHYVMDVAYSPDGSRIASAHRDGRARIWNSSSGALLTELDAHANMIVVLAFSPEGTELLTAGAGEDHTIARWEVETGRELARLRGHRAAISDLSYSPDRRSFVSASADGTARIWREDHPGLTLTGHEDALCCASYSPDGARVATASSDGAVRIWDADGGALEHVLTGHGSKLLALRYAPDGRSVASADQDGGVRLWDPTTGRLLQVFDGHRDSVYALAFAPTSEQLASAGKDGFVRIWETSTGRPLATLQGHEHTVRDLAYSPDGRQLASASHDRSLRLWDPRVERPLELRNGHRDVVYGVAFSPHDDRVATASWDGTARIWSRSGELLAVLARHEGRVQDVVYAPDGATLATASASAVRIWSPSGTLLETLVGHTKEINMLSYAPNGRLIASASEDGTARIWDLFAPHAEPMVLDGHGRQPVHSVRFSPNGALAITTSYDKRAKLWDLHEGQLVHELEGHEHFVYEAAFSPDSRRVATVSKDHSARIWDVATGACLNVLEGHGDPVPTVLFAPDGRALATGSVDGSVRIWDAQTGSPLQVLDGQGGPVHTIAYSPDGSRLASGSADGVVRIWQSSTGELLGSGRGHDSEITELVFSPDGAQILSASEDHSAKLWASDSGALLESFSDRIGVSQPDGSLASSRQLELLLSIACRRFMAHASAYADAREICERVLASE